MIRIRELRTRKKLSQEEFARTLGLSSATLRSYETGKTTPDEKIIDRICEVYDVSPEWLTGEDLTTQAMEPVEGVPVEAADVRGARVQVKKPSEKKGGKKKAFPIKVIIESKLGGTIQAEEILSKVRQEAPDVAEIYIKTEENSAYWVSKKSAGSVKLW